MKNKLVPRIYYITNHKRLYILTILVCICYTIVTGAATNISNTAIPNTTFTNHLTQLQLKVPKGFTVVVQSPFVVIGDETPERVQQWATNVVKWATDKLKQDYFTQDPQEIIDIWLFRNQESYLKYAKQLFHDTPTTPYGYYSSQDHALIMNVATGGGTLVHELVHPFMRANFPACPAWFNEGLASLYEQSAERNGHIYGLTNWRLKGLQDAIKNGKLISFQKLTAMDDDEFYNRNNDSNYNDNYAQARYLCYYLQEKGLLVKYYHEFTANQKSDPTGYNTLKRTLAENDMELFKKKWETFVLNLSFP